MIPTRSMHLSICVRVGRVSHLSGRLPTALQVRHHTTFHPRLPQHQDAIHVGKFVAGALLTFSTLGFGLYALRNGTFDELSPLTLGAAHSTNYLGSDYSSRHRVHHQNNAVDSPSNSEAGLSFPDTPISLASSYGGHQDIEDAIKELRLALPGQHRVQTNNDSLELYGSSENSHHPSLPHSVIVQVKSTEDVVKVVGISRKYRVPLVPYSGATSLEGHFSGVSTLALMVFFRIS